mgnify:CR=1 FL=1
MKTMFLLLPLLLAGCVGQPMWPTTSTNPVLPQEHPTLAESLRRQGVDGSQPYRLAVFGDQRALADGEFQALVRSIADREASLEGAPPLIAIIDTGDIAWPLAVWTGTALVPLSLHRRKLGHPTERSSTRDGKRTRG